MISQRGSIMILLFTLCSELASFCVSLYKGRPDQLVNFHRGTRPKGAAKVVGKGAGEIGLWSY